MGGMVSQNIMNLVDTAMVGSLGDDVASKDWTIDTTCKARSKRRPNSGRF